MPCCKAAAHRVCVFVCCRRCPFYASAPLKHWIGATTATGPGAANWTWLDSNPITYTQYPTMLEALTQTDSSSAVIVDWRGQAPTDPFWVQDAASNGYTVAPYVPLPWQCAVRTQCTFLADGGFSLSGSTLNYLKADGSVGQVRVGGLV